MKVSSAAQVTRLLAIAAMAIAGQKGIVTGAPGNQPRWSSSRQQSAKSSTSAPQYEIFDIGLLQAGDSFSHGFGVSPGGMAVGRSVRADGSQAFTWTLASGIVGLPNLAGRAYAVANSANDNGTVVGTASKALFNADALPVMWQNGSVSQLPLPPGQTIGDANSVNASGAAVGSANVQSKQRGVIYSGGSGSIITQTTATGCYFITALGINDFGRIVGRGADPNNAARNVGMVYDTGQPMAFEVGALPGMNGAIAYGVSNSGFVVGASTMDAGGGLPYIWSDQGGIVAIPLASDTSEGAAQAINSKGQVVGTDAGTFAIPFLYDGTTTWRLADLIPPNSGWDLAGNLVAKANGINDAGVIVGTGLHNGDTRAFAMVPMTTPTPMPRPTPTPRPHPSPRPRPTP